MQRYWVDQKIRSMKPPRTIGLDAIPQLLERLPGSICYLPPGLVGRLKAVSIDGESPDSSGYLLR